MVNILFTYHGRKFKITLSTFNNSTIVRKNTEKGLYVDTIFCKQYDCEMAYQVIFCGPMQNFLTVSVFFPNGASNEEPINIQLEVLESPSTEKYDTVCDAISRHLVRAIISKRSYNVFWKSLNDVKLKSLPR